MAEQFLHGVEVIEVLDGPRPIQTVKSSVIGFIGTAPDAAQEVKASLSTGSEGGDTGLTFTSKLPGTFGNNIAIRFRNPVANSAALAVTVSNQVISVSLATDAGGVITSTAAQVKTAIEGKADAHALVAITNTGGSDGSGVVGALNTLFLAGGEDEAFPINTPVLVTASRSQAARAGITGTIKDGLDAIFDQTGAAVVVVRVEEEALLADTQSNIIGDSADKTGMWAFTAAETILGLRPRILIAPGFSHVLAVASELSAVAARMRAVCPIDGPNTNDAAAIAYGQNFGTGRIYITDPQTQVFRSGATINEPASSRVAGLIARSDNERGFWWSPSNQEIYGITGTSRPVDFMLGDPNCGANILNENNIATIIRKNGFRLWGNRTTSADPRYKFLSVRRTADMIFDSIQEAHMWAVDRGITKTYYTDVAESVNAYLRKLRNLGAIIGGKCWADPDLNSPANISNGEAYWNFDFGPTYPAEHLIFRAHLNNDYLEELV